MTRKKRGVRTAAEWYEKSKATYDDLVSNLRELLKSLLTAEGIAFVDVQGRSKSVASFTEKITKKSYDNPAEEVTDLAGLRVITLTESDIVRVESILSRTFRVYPESVNKSDALGSDRMGYRSVHLICDLGAERLALPELKRFAACRFEIQIRTSLQHAWAEIEHDRGYKLRGTLPSHLKRKFSLLAGLLELADAQFDELSRAVDKYSEDVAQKASVGNLSFELNASSIRELLALRFGGVQEPYSADLWPVLIQELQDFGVQSLEDFGSLLTPQVMQEMRGSSPSLAIPGLVRDAMMLTDVQKYFDQAWKFNWGGIDRDSYQVLCQKYGEYEVDQLLDVNGVGREWEFDNTDFEEK